MHFNSEEEFRIYAERKALEFNERYGVDDHWTDAKFAQALADTGMPPLQKIPDEPRGMMLADNPPPYSAIERYRWRRVNAGHLLGHVIVHNGERCNGCKDWGAE